MSRRPINAVKPDIAKLSRSELKTYLAVLSDQSAWNPSLKFLVRAGEVDVDCEKAAVEKQLGDFFNSHGNGKSL